MRLTAGVLAMTALPFAASSQKPTDIHLDSVEVVASKTSRPLKSTAPAYKLDNQEFTRLGVTDISDAIHRLPGVNLRDYGGLGGLKTVSVRGLGAPHTAVIYDGIVLSDCQSGEVDVSRYSLDNVESLSMVIGDNDDIFQPARVAASAASFSISSFRQPDPTKPLDLTAQVKYGSFGYINPYFRVGKALSESFSLNLIGDYTYAENDYPYQLKNGAHTTTERRNNSRMNSGHGEFNASWSPDSRSTLSAKLYYYDNDRQIPGPAIYYNNENHETLRDRNFFGQLQYRKAFNSKWSMQLHGKFNWASSLYHDEDGKYPGGELNQNYWQREAYGSACVLFLPSDKWAFDYSADYFFNNFTSNLPTETFPRRNSILQSLTGRYRIKRLTVSARLLGSIYDNSAKIGEGARDYSRLSPSASLSVQPFGSEMFFMRLSYKNIFRMPTFNETYFYHYGNPDVRPETANQYNFGLTYQFKPTSWFSNLEMTADVYLNQVKDKIVAIPYNMFVWTVVNLDKARIIGFDFTETATFNVGRRQQILLTGNYSYQRAEPRTRSQVTEYKKQIAYIPRHSGNVTVSYENPWVNLSLHTTAVSGRFATNNNNPSTYLGGYADMGLTAYRTFGFRKHEIEVRGDIMNLLDRQYVVVARYPMPGRSWRLTVKFTL
ncbi:TonB-dependent siderophore receptor [uncultured Duncaniella sp.]|uniref:TonB-dependent receptor plug domain-containing protein n=3 Tax=uncultured Duncaniella sp. TaxID=2768039 RepID=UPI00261DCF04|nr:TonB-dependent receptor [uncultured Duncaniella sp.]